MSEQKTNDLLFWKSKYATLIREFESTKVAVEQREKSLCRSVIRLTLATSGLDPALDPHLTQIRDLLKGDIATEELLTEVNSISETLLRQAKSADKGKNLLKNDRTILFQFLKHIATGHAEREMLSAIEKKVEAGEIENVDVLFSELQTIMRLHSSSPVVEAPESQRLSLISRFLGKGGSSGSEIRIDAQMVRDRLTLLLDAIEIPLCFQDQSNKIKKHLAEEKRPEALQQLLNNAINLLSEIKSYIQREQQEIESFLEILTGKLGELEKQAVGVDT
jgi:diguanylate cyclase